VSAGPVGVRGVIEAYTPAFLAELWISPADAERPEALAAVADRLPEPARDLLFGALLAAGPGEALPERARPALEEEGESLLRAGLILPKAAPRPGVRIDPRLYLAAVRVNPYVPLPVAAPGPGAPPCGALDPTALASPPPQAARWDAVVVAAALEADPPRLTQGGALRRDDLRRLLGRLGPDEARWELALGVARATGLARAAGGALHGFPEARARPLTDPVALLPEELAPAAALLLRAAMADWVELSALSDALARRCPWALAPPARRARWADREAVWLRDAADLLHRLGAIDARRGADGVVALRRASPAPERSPGILLTPDREVLVAPFELPLDEYGRLCRCAPYVDGDVLHRHRLSAAGVAADLEAGHEAGADELETWLSGRSRTGLPGAVRDALRAWTRQATRVCLYSGVTVLEAPGQPSRFTLLTGPAPAGARELRYRPAPPAAFRWADGELRVPFGQDALTVRALMDRLGAPLGPGAGAWRWTLAPGPVEDAERLLDELRRFADGELPGAVEAAVRARAGAEAAVLEPIFALRLPADLLEPLLRDPELGPLLAQRTPDGRALLDAAALPAVQARLRALGVALGAPAAP